MSDKKRSLTREIFLNELVVKPVSVEVNGTLINIRPVSEVQRSKRASQMFDKKGEIDTSYLEKRRVFMLIDHLCDEDGMPLFSERDVKKLQELDSHQIDPYFLAIEKALGPEEGNE